MNVNEQLKSKIDEIDLDTKLAQLAEAAASVLDQAKEQAGSLIHDNRDKLDEFIEKATAAIDEKTEGKYHDKVEKAKASFASGLDKLAEVDAEADADAAAGPSVPESEMHVGEEAGAVADAAAGSISEHVAEVADAVDADPVHADPVDAEPTDPNAWENASDDRS